MLDTVIIGQFERRLLELGCPARQARDKARELSDQPVRVRCFHPFRHAQ